MSLHEMPAFVTGADHKICYRIEKEIIEKVIDALLAEGYTLSVNDGEETTLRRSTNKVAILSAMYTTEEDYILVHRAGEKPHFAWVRCIYGNRECVISDYSTNLESVIDPISEWIESHW